MNEMNKLDMLFFHLERVVGDMRLGYNILGMLNDIIKDVKQLEDEGFKVDEEQEYILSRTKQVIGAYLEYKGCDRDSLERKMQEDDSDLLETRTTVFKSLGYRMLGYIPFIGKSVLKTGFIASYLKREEFERALEQYHDEVEDYKDITTVIGHLCPDEKGSFKQRNAFCGKRFPYYSSETQRRIDTVWLKLENGYYSPEQIAFIRSRLDACADKVDKQFKGDYDNLRQLVESHKVEPKSPDCFYVV